MKGILAFVVTNQSGVARGLFGESQVQGFHTCMQADLARSGAHLDAFRYCPHHPEGVIAPFGRACDCRKPADGMIRGLLQEFDLLPKDCHLFGDKPTDLQAAAAAGVPATLVAEDDLLIDLVRRVFGP